MELTIGQQFKTKWGIWVLTAITDGSDFKCDNCGKYRKHLYEFLGYTKQNTYITNPGGFTYHAFYGSKCVKEFIKSLSDTA